MGIKEIATDTVMMQNDIKELEDALGTVKSKMESMFTNMKALDNMWLGTANIFFMAQFNKDYNDLKELSNILTNLVENIKAARGEYEKCESSVSTVIKNIRIETI